MKTTLLISFLLVESTISFLSPSITSFPWSRQRTQQQLHRSSSSSSSSNNNNRRKILVLQHTSNRYHNAERRAPFAYYLERDFRELKEKLRRDLLQLKHKQTKVVQDEQDLLQQTINVTEFERFAEEMDVELKEKNLEQAHTVVQQAQDLKQRARSETEWAIARIALLQSMMEPDHRDLDSFLLLRQAAFDLKQCQEWLERSQSMERKAVEEETEAEDLLRSLKERESHLKEILASADPMTLQHWTEDELTQHLTHTHTSRCFKPRLWIGNTAIVGNNSNKT